MRNKLETYSNDEIIEVLNYSKSFKEVLETFEYSTNGSGGYVHAKKIIESRGITIPKYHYYGDGKSNTKYDLDEILVENSKYSSRTRLKTRLVNERLLEYKCAKCENDGYWMGEKLVLQLEHKNGINNDNRIENLELLCPNCHSQSKTFGGRNNKQPRNENRKTEKNRCKCGVEIKRKSKMCVKCRNEYLKQKNRKVSNRPNKEILNIEVQQNGYRGTGKKYGVSDNTIRNWLK